MPPPPENARPGRLVAALERWFKTDLRYLASGGFWLTIDQVAGGLAAFALAIAFAHFVPKEAYGSYRYLVSAFWILTAFSLTGIPAALAQAVARGHDGAYRLALRTSMRWGLPLCVAAAGAGVYYFVNENYTFGYGLLIIAALGPFMQPSALFGAYLAGKKQFQMLALTGALYAGAPAAGLFAAMLFTSNPLAFIAVYLASNIATGFLLTILLFLRYKPDEAPSVDVRPLGTHFSAMNLLSTIAAQIDKIVVFHYLGAVELAVYSFAVAMPEQARGVLGSVSVLATPKFVTRPFGEIRRNYWNRLLLFTLGLAAAAGLYAFAAPYLFHIFFSTYAEAIPYSQLFALALIPVGSAISTSLLQAHEAKRELYLLNILVPVFQIPALIFLTSWYGLTGTIIARILGRIWAFLVSGALVETYARRLSRR